MDVPENFKFDVRVRDRMLAKGIVSDAEVTKHLDKVADVQGNLDAIELGQPALMSAEERERLVVAPRPSAVVLRPLAPAPLSPLNAPKAPALIDDEDDIDDDEDDIDDDEDDDEDEVDAAKPKVAAKEPAKPEAEPAKDRGEEE